MNTFESIYAKMATTNYNYLASNLFSFDCNLQKNDKKCVALVANGEYTFSNEWYTFLESLKLFSPSLKYAIPQIHHTFLVVKQWKDYNDTVNSAYRDPSLINSLKQNLPEYTITFDRFIPVKSGLVLCGTPTIDVNSVREYIRKHHSIDREQYHLDICHITVIRWEKQLTVDEQKTFLEEIKKFPVQPYITLSVDRIDVVHATWLMHPGDITVLNSIDLKKT